MSLPSSPVNKEGQFDTFEEIHSRKERKVSGVEKSKPSTAPSNSMTRKTFLEGFRLRSSRTKSDDMCGNPPNRGSSSTMKYSGAVTLGSLPVSSTDNNVTIETSDGELVETATRRLG